MLPCLHIGSLLLNTVSSEKDDDNRKRNIIQTPKQLQQYYSGFCFISLFIANTHTSVKINLYKKGKVFLPIRG